MGINIEERLEEIIDKKMQLCPSIIEEEPQYNGAILCRIPKPSDTKTLYALIDALDKITTDWTFAGFPVYFATIKNNFEVCYNWRFEYSNNLYDLTEVD